MDERVRRRDLRDTRTVQLFGDLMADDHGELRSELRVAVAERE